MRILIFGAGVLGTLYAARLKEAGHRVRVLARGRRLEDLARYGLSLKNVITGRSTFAPVETIERLGPDDDDDLVIVPVRKTQLASTLPVLAANRRVPSVLFMVCNASGPDEMAAALGPDRVVLGYAGAGGVRSGPLVCFAEAPRLLQRTVIGEIDGRRTPRLRAIAKALRGAGFPTAMSSNMDAWLKTHAAWVYPTALALYRQGGDARRLSASPESLRLLVQAIRGNLAALGKLGVPVTGPFWVRLHARLPSSALAALWRTTLRTEMARWAMAGHANEAREEMDRVGSDWRALVAAAGLPNPALDELAVPIGGETPLSARMS